MVLIIDVIPNTDARLNIFDPIIFPSEMAFSCLIAAIIEAASSGMLVPTATNETDITASLTSKVCAKSMAPSTNHSDPKNKAVPPIAACYWW